MPQRRTRGASTAEWVIILAAVSIAVIGIVTLFGRRIAKLFTAATRSIDDGAPKSASLQFPTGNVPAGFAPPTGNLPGSAPANEAMPAYQSLLGPGVTNAASLIGGTPPVYQAPTLANLPQQLIFPTNVTEAFSAAFRESRPIGPLPPGGFPIDTDTDGDGIPDFSSQLREHGATLVIDGTGNLILANAGPGSTAGFQPNGTVPAGTTQVGVFHTHPWEHDEGTIYSAADIVGMFGDGNGFEVVQTTDGHQWALVQTTTSWPPGTTAAGIRATYNTAYATRMAAIMADPALAALPAHERHALATEAAVRQTATTYNLGLYHGTAGFPLTRVVP